MFTEAFVIVTDSAGDGSKTIERAKPFIFSGLRGFKDSDRVEFFRLYYVITDKGDVAQEGGDGGGGGGGGGGDGAVFRSKAELIRGVEVGPNQKLVIKVAGGTAFASSNIKCAINWRFV